MKDCKESCMEAIRRGQADIMMAEGEEIYKGGKIYDLIPIMAEKDQSGRSKHYSIVLAEEDKHRREQLSGYESEKILPLGRGYQSHIQVPDVFSHQKGRCSESWKRLRVRWRVL